MPVPYYHNEIPADNTSYGHGGHSSFICKLEKELAKNLASPLFVATEMPS